MAVSFSCCLMSVLVMSVVSAHDDGLRKQSVEKRRQEIELCLCLFAIDALSFQDCSIL